MAEFTQFTHLCDLPELAAVISPRAVPGQAGTAFEGDELPVHRP